MDPAAGCHRYVGRGGQGEVWGGGGSGVTGQGKENHESIIVHQDPDSTNRNMEYAEFALSTAMTTEHTWPQITTHSSKLG